MSFDTHCCDKGYSYKPSCARPGKAVILTSGHSDAQIHIWQ